MPLYEYRGNMHCHTPYSDGALYHAELAQEAIAAGLDFVIVTDHNVWVQGVERYYVDARPQPPLPPRPAGYPAMPPPAPKRVLLLSGEEIHDVRRNPQANHCLVYGAECEMAPHASNPQELLDATNAAGGLAFLAHPLEKAAPMIGELALDWKDWDARGYTGIEIWNYMSEFKGNLRYVPMALGAILNPARAIKGPYPGLLAKWDSLLAEGKRVVGIGGADAHGLTYSIGPFKRTVFPYEDLFRTVNTHIITKRPLTGDVAADKAIVYEALREGHCFVGYDQATPTTGFRFSASGWRTEAILGDIIPVGNSVTLQVRTPAMSDLRIVRQGEVMAHAPHATNLTLIAHEPGMYRTEVYVYYQGRSRGWIFSNPIYVTKG